MWLRVRVRFYANVCSAAMAKKTSGAWKILSLRSRINFQMESINFSRYKYVKPQCQDWIKNLRWSHSRREHCARCVLMQIAIYASQHIFWACNWTVYCMLRGQFLVVHSYVTLSPILEIHVWIIIWWIEMFSALSLTQWRRKQNRKINYNSEAVESKI